MKYLITFLIKMKNLNSLVLLLIYCSLCYSVLTRSRHFVTFLKNIKDYRTELRTSTLGNVDRTNDMILKSSSKLIEIDKNLIKSIHFVSKVINSTFKTSHWPLKNDSS